MSGQERGVIRLMWKHFLASLTRTSTTPRYVGEDRFGTKYFEKTSTRPGKRPSRFFIPETAKPDSELDPFGTERPAEWDSWLRHTRKEPPTAEELEQNYQLMLTKKKKAAELQARYSEEKDAKALDVPVRKRGYESFPAYKEYDSGAPKD